MGHILGDKFTVLVVDDNPGILEMMTDILDNISYNDVKVGLFYLGSIVP